jgi:hypothetical protein
MARQELQLAHRVERAGDHRLGYAEARGQPAHGVRRWVEIDRKQDSRLAHGEIRPLVADLRKVDLLP